MDDNLLYLRQVNNDSVCHMLIHSSRKLVPTHTGIVHIEQTRV